VDASLVLPTRHEILSRVCLFNLMAARDFKQTLFLNSNGIRIRRCNNLRAQSILIFPAVEGQPPMGHDHRPPGKRRRVRARRQEAGHGSQAEASLRAGPGVGQPAGWQARGHSQSPKWRRCCASLRRSPRPSPCSGAGCRRRGRLPPRPGVKQGKNQ